MTSNRLNGSYVKLIVTVLLIQIKAYFCQITIQPSSLPCGSDPNLDNRNSHLDASLPLPDFRPAGKLVDYVPTDNFYHLVARNNLFIDKSLFIEEFLNSDQRISIITRPSKWAKSVNMDMLNTFLEINLNEDSEFRVSDLNYRKENNVNRKLFIGGDVELRPFRKFRTLKPLKIAQRTDIITRYQGRFPTIHINFGVVYGVTYDEIVDRLVSEIVFLFDQYSFVGELNKTDKFNQYLVRECLSSDRTLLEDSLRFLSKALNSYFKEKVYVLIDEFDTPISQFHSYLYHYFNETSIRPLNNNTVIDSFHFNYELNRTVQLFRRIYKRCFVDNSSIEKVLITGRFRAAGDADFFSELPVREYNISSDKFGRYFGFDESEVSDLYHQISSVLFVSLKISLIDMKKWYGGYKLVDNLVYYNPWSVMNCLNENGTLSHYWIDSEPNHSLLLKIALKQFVPIQNDIKRLLANKCITLDRAISYPLSVKFTSDYFRDHLIWLLLSTGYLTFCEEKEKSFYTLRIPNEETRHFYETIIKLAYKRSN